MREGGQGLRDRIALGVLTATFPPGVVDEVVEAAAKREQRYRFLPARLVVYYVLAMSLFREAGYEEVMRQLTEGLAGVDPDAPSLEVPSSVAISKARQRLGKEPLEALFARVCVPIATASTRGAYYRGQRLVSMDGTVLDVADTPSNLTAFGRHHSGRGEAAFPQIRIVALAECGTHAMFAAKIGGSGEGENTIAEPLATACRPGMLVLADRGFGGSYELFGEFAERGCDLVWRVKKHAALADLEQLSDGSFRSELPRRAARPARPVRVVEYEIDDPGWPAAEDTTYHLVTTILDPESAPAAELAALYAERWEFETALDELKTHQRGARIVLRSVITGRPPTAFFKRPGACSASTTRSARSCAARPRRARLTQIGSASPARCALRAAASDEPSTISPPASATPPRRSSTSSCLTGAYAPTLASCAARSATTT